MIGAAVEVRDFSPTAWAMNGTVSRFVPPPWFIADASGTYLELVKPECFDPAVAGDDAVELRREHAPNSHVYADTTSGTMKFEKTAQALLLGAALTKSDTATRTLVSEIKAGKLNGLSVGATVLEDTWGLADDGRTSLRTWVRAQLSEVSVVARPAVPGATVDVRYEQRSAGGLEFRSFPLVFRQMSPDSTAPGYGGDEDDWETCLACGGSGQASDGMRCAVCAGLGQIPAENPDEDDDAVRALRDLRRRYSDRERQALARKGYALSDGSFPVADRVDLANAIKSIGRAKDYNRARNHIITRARALNAIDMLPASWNVKRSVAVSSFDELEAELELLKAGPSRLARRHRGPTTRDQAEPTTRDQAETDWRRGRESRQSEYLQALWTPSDRPR